MTLHQQMLEPCNYHIRIYYNYEPLTTPNYSNPTHCLRMNRMKGKDGTGNETCPQLAPKRFPGQEEEKDGDRSMDENVSKMEPERTPTTTPNVIQPETENRIGLKAGKQ